MPHVHSADASARRLARAIAKGFVKSGPNVASWDANSRLISVPTEVAARVKVVAKSLSLHKVHCELLQANVHNASVAAAKAKPIIGLDEYNKARRCHRAANLAEHWAWCDAIDSDQEP